MQRLDGRLVLSPTDLTAHQECRHLTRLDLGVTAGEWAKPDAETPEELQFVFARGLDHEKKYLDSLTAAGKTVAEIAAASGAEGRRRAEEQTVEAMRSGVDVVYQGTFFDGAWGGQADFLLRVETPSPVTTWIHSGATPCSTVSRSAYVAICSSAATFSFRASFASAISYDQSPKAGDGVSTRSRKSA